MSRLERYLAAVCASDLRPGTVGLDALGAVARLGAAGLARRGGGLGAAAARAATGGPAVAVAARLLGPRIVTRAWKAHATKISAGEAVALGWLAARRAEHAGRCPACAGTGQLTKIYASPPELGPCAACAGSGVHPEERAVELDALERELLAWATGVLDDECAVFISKLQRKLR